MPVTFQVVGNLADFGNDPRAGVKVHATASPGVKVGDVAVHSNEPETVVTDAAGAFTLELVSLPGVWYTIRTPYSNAINTVRLAGYTPDVEDPTTGTEFPALTVINLRTVMDEDPTPGYEGLVYSGPPNVLTIGTVTTGAPGSDADADIGGVSPSQTLDLVIPRGDVGPKGDTGDTGDVGPKGDKGDKGDTGDVGPKGDTGDTGDVGPKGDKGDKGDTGDVGPKGDTGDDSTVPGPPNVLAVGTVTTGAAGTSAAASITGASPVQTLNLTIPKGDPGGWVASSVLAAPDLNTMTTAGLYYLTGAHTNSASVGESHVEVVVQGTNTLTQMQTVGSTGRIFRRTRSGGTWTPWLELVTKGSIGSGDLTGTGSPEGVITAPVGTYYTDTAITNGAMRWVKMSGTGNTGWKCPDYDSGLRRIDFADFAAPFNVTGSQAYLRRLGDAVHYSALLYTTSTLAAGNHPWTGAPYLWGLGANMYGVTGASPLWNSNNGAYLGTLTSSSVVVPATIPAGTPMRGRGVAVWAAPIPTSLPGTAA